MPHKIGSCMKCGAEIHKHPKKMTGVCQCVVDGLVAGKSLKELIRGAEEW